MAMAMIVAVPRVSISLGGWLSISFPFLSSPVAIMMVRVVAAVVAIVTQAMSITIGKAMDACVAMVAMAIVIPGVSRGISISISLGDWRGFCFSLPSVVC